MRPYILSLLFFAVSHLGFSQTGVTLDVRDTAEVVYIPVEGKGPTPADLRGNWILTSGISKTKPAKNIFVAKPKPGTILSTSTSTNTHVNGSTTTTTTQEEVTMVADPGPGITPPQKDEMHQPDRPSISFFGENRTVSGFTGCNRFSGNYTVSGNRIRLTRVAASTEMQCIGNYNENDFLSKLRSANRFSVQGSSLHLLRGSQVVLTFRRG